MIRKTWQELVHGGSCAEWSAVSVPGRRCSDFKKLGGIGTAVGGCFAQRVTQLLRSDGSRTIARTGRWRSRDPGCACRLAALLVDHGPTGMPSPRALPSGSSAIIDRSIPGGPLSARAAAPTHRHTGAGQAALAGIAGVVAGTAVCPRV